MKFTVLVITYNAKWEKLKLTLSSILRQSMTDYEIVIADDGSKDNMEQTIREYFAKQGFSGYKLVMNEKNQGTVANLISGLAVTEGEYVKFISAGDLLYCEDTLQMIYDFMIEHHSESCFGLIQGYRMADGHIQKVGYYHPFDMNAYRKGDKDRIMKNLVLYSDNVCGASITYENHFAKEFMNRIKDDVKYEEDIFQVLAAVEGRGVDFIDEYLIWYEIGEGITTQKKSGFEALVRQDVDRFYRRLYEWHGNNPYVKKRYQLLGLYKITNLYVRTFLRFFINPDALRYFVDTTIQRKKKVHEKPTTLVGFLEEGNYAGN